jgi:hypothetical protein
VLFWARNSTGVVRHPCAKKARISGLLDAIRAGKGWRIMGRRGYLVSSSQRNARALINQDKENQNPDAKWRNFRHYTNGQMYVFYKDQKSKQASSRYAQTAMQHPNDVVYLFDLNIAHDHLAEKGTI